MAPVAVGHPVARRMVAPIKAVAAPEAAPKLAIAGDVSSLIGNTPMVYLNKITEGIEGAKIAAKLESQGMGGMVWWWDEPTPMEEMSQ